MDLAAIRHPDRHHRARGLELAAGSARLSAIFGVALLLGACSRPEGNAEAAAERIISDTARIVAAGVRENSTPALDGPEDASLRADLAAAIDGAWLVEDRFDWEGFEGRLLLAYLAAFVLPVGHEDVPYRIETVHQDQTETVQDDDPTALVRVTLDAWRDLPEASQRWGFRRVDGDWRVERAPLSEVDGKLVDPHTFANTWLTGLLGAMWENPNLGLIRYAAPEARKMLVQLATLEPDTEGLGLDPVANSAWSVRWVRRFDHQGTTRAVEVAAERTATGWRVLSLEWAENPPLR